MSSSMALPVILGRRPAFPLLSWHGLTAAAHARNSPSHGLSGTPWPSQLGSANRSSILDRHLPRRRCLWSSLTPRRSKCQTHDHYLTSVITPSHAALHETVVQAVCVNRFHAQPCQSSSSTQRSIPRPVLGTPISRGRWRVIVCWSARKPSQIES